MPSARVPSATGEQPCAPLHPRAPPCSTPCAYVQTPSVTRGPVDRCPGHGRYPLRRPPVAPPAGPARPRGRRGASRRPDAPLVRERPGMAHGARCSPATGGGRALRRPGRARGGGRRGAGAAGRGREGLPGGTPGGPDAAADRRRRRRRAAGPAGVAGVGRAGPRPAGARRGPPDGRPRPVDRRGRAGTARAPGRGASRRRAPGQSAGGRRMAAAPEPGREAEASLPTLSAMGTRSPRGVGDGPRTSCGW